MVMRIGTEMMICLAIVGMLGDTYIIRDCMGPCRQAAGTIEFGAVWLIMCAWRLGSRTNTCHSIPRRSGRLGVFIVS